MADETIDDGDSAAAKSVAADIASFGKSREISAEEQEQRRLLSEVRDRQRIRWEQECRIAHQREQAEVAAQAERQAALAAEQHRQRVSRDIMERSQRSRETAGIYERLNRAEQFRNHVVAEARRNAAIQQRQALIADLDASINPPPAPEAPVIIVEQQSEGSPELGSADFDPTLFARKPRSWW